MSNCSDVVVEGFMGHGAESSGLKLVFGLCMGEKTQLNGIAELQEFSRSYCVILIMIRSA